jgi:hypothetical protein
LQLLQRKDTFEEFDIDRRISRGWTTGCFRIGNPVEVLKV